MAEKPKHRCPMCGGDLMPRYNPKMNTAPTSGYNQSDYAVIKNLNSDLVSIPMRCPKCVINMTVRVDPATVEQKLPSMEDYGDEDEL